MSSPWILIIMMSAMTYSLNSSPDIPVTVQFADERSCLLAVERIDARWRKKHAFTCVPYQATEARHER